MSWPLAAVRALGLRPREQGPLYGALRTQRGRRDFSFVTSSRRRFAIQSPECVGRDSSNSMPIELFEALLHAVSTLPHVDQAGTRAASSRTRPRTENCSAVSRTPTVHHLTNLIGTLRRVVAGKEYGRVRKVSGTLLWRGKFEGGSDNDEDPGGQLGSANSWPANTRSALNKFRGHWLRCGSGLGSCARGETP